MGLVVSWQILGCHPQGDPSSLPTAPHSAWSVSELSRAGGPSFLDPRAMFKAYDLS